MDCLRECAACPSDIPPQPCSTPSDILPPCSSDIPASATLYVYSNDGSELLASAFVGDYDGGILYSETSGWILLDKYIYGVITSPLAPHLILDCSEYDGLSDTVNATQPNIPEGEIMSPSATSDVTVYVVGGSPTPTVSTLDVTYNSAKIIDSLSVTPPVTVTYGGSTIATLNESDTKTLQCNGKVMSSNVGIGGKTLQCNGKLMASDVVVEVGGGGEITDLTGYTWYGNETIDTSVFDEDVQKWSVLFRMISGVRDQDVGGIGGGASVHGYVGMTYYFVTDPRAEVYSAIENTWYDESYRSIKFRGGVDATNAELIAWLQANGTLTPPSRETWVINETPEIGRLDFYSFGASFVSNGEYFDSLTIEGSRGGNPGIYYLIDIFLEYICAYDLTSWTDDAYRTITLDEPATGDFLTWLQSNAVKQ